VEGPVELPAEESGELLPARDEADLVRELLEDESGVVGVAEEGTVDEAGRAPDQGRRHAGQEEAEANARGRGQGRLHPQQAAERQREEGGGLCSHQDEEHHEPRFTRTYRALRLRRTGSSSTRCFTTA